MQEKIESNMRLIADLVSKELGGEVGFVRRRLPEKMDEYIMSFGTLYTPIKFTDKEITNSEKNGFISNLYITSFKEYIKYKKDVVNRKYYD